MAKVFDNDVLLFLDISMDYRQNVHEGEKTVATFSVSLDITS